MLYSSLFNLFWLWSGSFVIFHLVLPSFLTWWRNSLSLMSGCVFVGFVSYVIICYFSLPTVQSTPVSSDEVLQYVGRRLYSFFVWTVGTPADDTLLPICSSDMSYNTFWLHVSRLFMRPYCLLCLPPAFVLCLTNHLSGVISRVTVTISTERVIWMPLSLMETISSDSDMILKEMTGLDINSDSRAFTKRVIPSLVLLVCKWTRVVYCKIVEATWQFCRRYLCSRPVRCCALRSIAYRGHLIRGESDWDKAASAAVVSDHPESY